MHVWLGGLFNPEAYITATRQCVAQASSWSLEELELDFKVENSSEKVQSDGCSFIVTGLKLLGAQCEANQLVLTSTISTELPITVLKWIRTTPDKPQSPNMVN